MRQFPIMVDYCTKYEQNQPIIFWDIARNIKFKKYIGISTQIWHSAKLYFTCFGNTWYLITAWSMNKINKYFSEQNVWKGVYNYSNVAQSQMLLYKHKQHIVPDITVWNMNKITTFFSEYHNRHSNVKEKIAIITHIWHRAKFFFLHVVITDPSFPLFVWLYSE